MNSQNSLKTIEYPSELDMRIAELEKELAPFLNTQNISFALKEILASAS
jgi:protein associated with RNAse G/E